MPAAPSDPTPERVASGVQGLVTAGLLFASGFAGLVYQVCWMRELGLLFGNTSFATATTLAAFFLGLAAGGAVFGSRAERFSRPLRAYAWLEFWVAVSALLYFALLRAFHAVYAPLFERLGDAPAAFVAVKFALSLAVLFPPAFFMGGTLPVMSQHLVRRAEALGRTAAALYAVNTAGAALGAYATAFHLVRGLGVFGAYAVALVTTLGVALLAGRLAGERAVATARAADPRRQGAPPAPLGRAALRALACLSGFATLALEVLWTRMFAQVLQNSVYTFALVLVTFLVSLAAGGGVARVLAGRSLDPLRALSVLLLGSGLLVTASPFVFVWESGGLGYLADASGFAGYVASVFGSALLVLLLPTAWLGVIFPYLLRVAEAWGESPGRTVGELAALNTLGAVVGSLVAGFVLLEALGLWASLAALAALYLVAALLLSLHGAGRTRLALAAAAGVGLALLAGPLDPRALPRVSVEARAAGEELLEILEGSAATVAVVQRPDSRRIKLNNHYGLGGSGDATQEARQAHLPLLLHPQPRRAFFLGMGTGITAGAALSHPLERLLVAELVPEVVEAARRHFTPWVGGLFEDPRARVVVEDGRHLLAGSSERFDVIVADLFLPWKAGTGSLYARELYAAGLERLAPGGLYAQWLLLIQLSSREFACIARTFASVFPHVEIWRGNYRPSHPLVLLVGRREPAPLDAAALERRIAALPGEAVTPRGTGRSPAPNDLRDLLLLYQGRLDPQTGLLRDAPINRDTHPFIEYSTPVTQREKRTDSARAFRGRELLAFYDALFEVLPPERDPVLAELPAGARGLPHAGLDLYRSRVLEDLGDAAGAAEALLRYRTPPDAGS
jgi:spermidine synthase